MGRLACSFPIFIERVDKMEDQDVNEQPADNPAKEAAKSKAKQHVQEHGMPDRDQAGEAVSRRDLVTADQLLATYETGFVRTESGLFEIQTVHPGDFVRFIKVPVLKLMLDHEIDIVDDKAMMDGIQNMPAKEMIETVSDDSFIELAQQVCCAGVVNVDFRMQPQTELDSKRRQVSIQVIPAEVTIVIYNAIMELSMPQEVADQLRSFREKYEEEAGRGDLASPDVQSVPEDSESIPVSESDES